MPVSNRPRVIETIQDYRQWRHKLGGLPSVGFVPTMGALHSGHGSLMATARAECEQVVVSIFVNPLQFGANEDFGRYPRTLASDLEICAQRGVDVVLHPSVSEIYPKPFEALTKVVPPSSLTERLCGLFRPGHFEGVTTVVMKLFGIVEPTRAYFGEKDFQQLAVIKQMVNDLNFPTAVIGVPTVREEDGLALSSRNIYLKPEQRVLAPALHKAISGILEESLSGRVTVGEAVAEAKADLEIPGLQLQYLEACDAETLEPLAKAARPMVVLVAVKMGDVRLIDNVIAR